MTRRSAARSATTALLVVGALLAPGCAAAPDEGCRLDDELLSQGIPTNVLWAGQAIEAAVDQGPGGDIVGMDLCRPDDGWRWAITRRATLSGDPTRGLVLVLDAVTGAVLSRTDVELSAQEAAASGLDVRGAVENSGETYPTPRLLSLHLEGDAAPESWTATIYDGDAALRTELSIDARTGGVRTTTTP